MSPSTAPAAAVWEPEDTEICNDDGFIYKRKRRRPSDDDGGGAPSSSAAAVVAERKARRARKKASLVKIRERYRMELEQWEGLAAALQGLLCTAASRELAPPQPATPWVASPGQRAVVEDNPFRGQIEELLFQVEAQEAAISKLSDACDVVESMCAAREEAAMRALAELPVWAESPRALVASLSSD